MKKILFISLAVVFALSVGLIGCEGEGPEPDVWDDVIYLDMHCTITQFASICTEVFNPWVDEAHALVGPDGGTFNITVTYGDAPFDAGASLVALTAGTVDIAQLAPDTFALGGVGYLPLLSPCMEATAYATYDMFTDPAWDSNGALSGVKVLITAPLWGAQWWGNTNITEAADFAGLDIRSDAQAVESATIQAFNATAIFLGTSELGNALQTGTVDGCFFTYTGWKGFSGVGPFTDYVTDLNLWYRPYSLAMNLDSYNDLPSDAQDALDGICGQDASVAYATLHKAAEAEDVTETENSGKDIYYPTPAQMATLEAATASVATEWETYMVDTLGFPAGIVAAYEALIAEYGACP